MFLSDDPVMDAERYMAHLDEKLARRPVCDCCREHIQGEKALHYNGIWLCGECCSNNEEWIEVDE
jgi:ribosomal protein L37AE/L43A